jgi:multimeric flavodoxin WrbA
MKLVCLLGSPRRLGNSATMAALVASRVRAAGGEVKTVYLNGLAYRGCQGCYACKRGAERCVIKDDLEPVLSLAAEADGLLLATPVYYGDVTGQLKCFIDRTFSWLVPDYPTNPVKSRLAAGKRLAMAISQGHPDEALFADVFNRYADFFSWLGFKEARLLRGCGLSERSNPVNRPELVAEADAIARWFMGENVL